ncbi:pre-mRNA splicing factor component-domain-containing protein [Dichotomocladium elegans]|nr:pre-mRNA splicing factor component-domain-containing protein [Dichotomocladium elegans]
MKVLIKGGIWKNTEDEILKAAVSKYGKNQWARISSLLVRKTPKQCKARWYEWLDPSIKKTEWSKEEDEKLLHLAKLMPTQWRTIAPIVGRTPAQCLERYQRLLDEAEAREAGVGDDLGLTGTQGPEHGPSADDVRRLRPGEVDPEPETKPARPDPVDMDEDEKEMLSEARARLANTQGKKAKRKARERQLEEARRLASLQKRRELKAAGIHLRIKKKKHDMDYNADIPFEKPVALGFYDTTEEKNRRVDPGKLTNVHLSKLNRRRADLEEEKAREKKRKARQAGKQPEPEGNQGRFVPAKDAKLLKAQEQEQIAKRRKLVLPAPQIGEVELGNIVKVGMSSENAKLLVQDEEQSMTSGLVEDLSSTPRTLPARTPRAANNTDALLQEARNLRALTETQTPLLGEENTPMHISSGGTGFEGATPRVAEIQTPNPLLTPRTDTSGLSTPRSAVNALEAKRNLRQGLLALPVPRNEYEIRLPDLDKESDKSTMPAEPMEEDMSDVDRRRKEAAAEEERERFARRSLAVQKDLPRPVVLPASVNITVDDEVEKMIQEEYLRLLKHDTIKYPVVGSKTAPGAVNLGELSGLEDEFDRATLEDARSELDEELRRTHNIDEGADIKAAIWKLVSGLDGFKGAWEAAHSNLLFSAKENRFLPAAEFSDEQDKIQGMAKMIESNRRTMIRDATQAGKLEKKLEVRLGGYMNRSEKLIQQIVEAADELEAARIEYNSFVTLQMSEKAAIPARVDHLQAEVDRLSERERSQQIKYKELTERKLEYLQAIEQLQ